MTVLRSLVRAARPLRVAVLLVVLAGTVAACGGNTGTSYSPKPSQLLTSSPEPTTPATVVTTSNLSLGTILVEAHGMTLYLFEKDSTGTSSCYGTCARLWPPLTLIPNSSDQPLAKGAANPSLLGTISRKDGSTQVTYRGHPLYTYQGDSKPGDTSGEGLNQFGATWYAVSPQGQKVVRGSS